MKAYLNSKGIAVKRKRIQRLMLLMDLESVAPKSNTCRQRKGHKVYPYLLKNMSITELDPVWYYDITFIRLANDFVYLTAVMNEINVMCFTGKSQWP
jgi:putative transposase